MDHARGRQDRQRALYAQDRHDHADARPRHRRHPRSTPVRRNDHKGRPRLYRRRWHRYTRRPDHSPLGHANDRHAHAALSPDERNANADGALSRRHFDARTSDPVNVHWPRFRSADTWSVSTPVAPPAHTKRAATCVAALPDNPAR